ncbi:hypothetical protein F5883DRAFT_460815 [Diaporthe sp. PMI_573]|nr:hypothetical protein F5883DRAFT_460815 [Diaporthaceae sp. PMI_573]
MFLDLTDNKNDDTPTVLNSIVDLVLSNVEASIDSASVKALVKRLVQQCTRFLWIPNDEQQNPLYVAIAKKKKILVDCMVTSCPEDDNGRQHLADALKDCRGNERRKNCLHLAFEKDLKPTTLKRMVEDASTEALEAVDTTGRRPMHYAVQYKHCNVEVISKFIDRDNELLKEHEKISPGQPFNTFLDVNKGCKTSVYQEHVSSASAHDQEWFSQKATMDYKTKKGEVSAMDDDGGKHARRQMEEATRGSNPTTKSKAESKRDPKSENKSAARLESANPAPSRDLKERTGRPRDRDRERRMDDNDDDALNELQKEREWRKQQEAEARRKELERISAAREASKDRRSLAPSGHRDALRIQTALGATPSSDVAANTPKPLRRVPTMREEIADGKSELKVKRTATVTKRSRRPVDHEAAARNSKTVLRMLKLHYMRTRNIERATSWLYDTNPQDVQTCFAQPRLPSELKDGLFKEAFQGTKFDEVLQFVRFPNVKVIQLPKANSKKKPSDGLGRWDMEFFFDFLYKRGVRYILKVFVEEGGQSVHSDEAIKSALDRIAVEHLDWQKIDLDPEIICGIGSQAEDMLDRNGPKVNSKNQLRTLDLRWSGNSAVLRAWSEPEGLPSLPHLRTVNIFVPDDLYDSTKWMEDKAKEFERRLNSYSIIVNSPQDKDQSASALSQRKVEVNFVGLKSHAGLDKKGAKLLGTGSNQGQTSGVVHEKVFNAHEWLRCIDAFVKNLNPLWTTTRNEYLKHTGVTSTGSDTNTTHRPAKLPGPEDEVVVALIDDGVSLLDQNFVGRVLGGKTFDYGHDVIGQSYYSARGHGTEMARCILRACPMAKIYPIRLKTQDSEDRTKTEINLQSAAMAIEAALEKNATIISMSWTVPIPENPTAAKQLFEKAVRKAVDQNVLMFCSSPDEGDFKISDYPSAVQRDKVFRIGAAHDYGKAANQVDKEVDFIFPGVEVNTSAASASPATGSSIATALAAGLAATVIYCFKICALDLKSQTQTMSQKDIERRKTMDENLKLISQHAGMKRAFGRIGPVNDSQFIQIWDQLDRLVMRLEDPNFAGHDNIKIEHILDFCTKLV